MSDVDLLPATPPRPDRRPRRNRGAWANPLLAVAIGVQLLIGAAYLLVSAVGGSPVFVPLMGAWALGLAVIILAAVEVGRGRWPTRAAWLAAAAIALTLAAFPVVLGPVLDLEACTGARRAAVLTVPPYGGGDAKLYGGQYGCGYTLELTEPIEPILRYYRDGFEQAGWNVRTSVASSEGSIEGGGTMVAGELVATRAVDTVTITYEGSGDGTYASVSLTAS